MSLLHVALLEPEIPPNTGNIARLCAANGLPLHLIGRLGFRTDDKHLKRAGCDYWPLVDVRRHDTMTGFESALAGARIFCLSARASVPYTRPEFRPGDCLLFGSESRGLPPEVLQRYADHTLTIPMLRDGIRSLNLATAVGIVVYEALRQLHDW